MFPKKMRPAKISGELAREVVVCDGHKICILLFSSGKGHHSKNMRRPCCDRKIGCYVLVGDFWIFLVYRSLSCINCLTILIKYWRVATKRKKNIQNKL